MKPLTPETILITGSSGFLGHHLISYFTKKHPDFFILAQSRSKAGQLPVKQSKQLKQVTCELKSIHSTHTLIKQYKPDYVIHLAAQNPSAHKNISTKQYIKGNVIPTYNLLESIRAFSPDSSFVNISTYEVFADQIVANKISPHSPYAASKAGAAHLTHSWHKTFNLKCTNLFFSNIYGPHQSMDKFIPQALVCGLLKKELKIFGSGQHQRAWLFINDACKAIEQVLMLEPKDYHAFGNNFLDLNQVVSSVNQLLVSNNFDQIVVRQTPGNKREVPLPTEPSFHALIPGWKPETPFREGLKKTLNWIKDDIT